MIKCGMLASKNAIARLTTTRTNTIGYIMVCMYVSLAHTQRETSALTDYLQGFKLLSSFTWIIYIFPLLKYSNSSLFTFFIHSFIYLSSYTLRLKSLSTSGTKTSFKTERKSDDIFHSEESAKWVNISTNVW